MATNPIQARDIISDDVHISLEKLINELKDISNNLNQLDAQLKNTSAQIKNAAQSTNDAAEMAKLTSQVSALREAYDKLKDAKSMNDKASKDFVSMQEAERAVFEKFQGTIRDVNALLGKNEQEIKTSELSYNRLSAAYSEMSSRLKNLSADEINATEENRKLALATKQVRDAMNEAQKAMGNYTLNVGRYHTAFDGLGFSIQQVLREVPSATNISQFFLAISNNIPQVIDQIKLFEEEQKNINRQLLDLQEGTKEYMEIQSKQMSLGTKLAKSILSWQTAILAALLLLRKLPDIIKSISEKLSNLNILVKELDNVNKGAADTIGEMTAKYKALQKEWNNLADDKKSEWVKNHADDWRELGMSINSVQEAENVYVNNTDLMMDAIKRRARSIAAMKLASDKYSEAFNKQHELEKKMQNDLGRERARASQNPTAFQEGAFSTQQSPYAFDEQRWIENRQKSIDATIAKMIKEADDYIDRFVIPEYSDIKNGGSGRGNGRTYSVREIDDLAKEAVMIESNSMEQSLAYQFQRIDDLMEKEIENLRSKMKKNTENYLYDEKHGLLTDELESEYRTANDNFSALMESLPTKYKKMKEEIVLKYNKEIMDSNNKLTEQEFEIIELELKESTVVLPKKVKSMDDEIDRNKKIWENIENITKAMKNLEQVDVWDENHLNERRKRLDELNKKMDEYRQRLDYTRQLANYKNFGDMLGSGNWLGRMADGDKRGFLYNLGIDVRYADDDQINSAFDTWEKNATEAITDVKDITVDALGEMLEAYVEFYEKRAEAAKEATDKAYEEYELEKDLLEAGYANNVDIAWREYEDKLALQKRAEEDARRAQLIQQEIQSLEQTTSLITATANILKDFAANPILAGTLITTMWGTFLGAKAMAHSITQYGDGGYEELTGGSHISGNDINLGVRNGKGRVMHVEGGETLGIFSRKANRKYGSATIGELVQSINDGTYETESRERLVNNFKIGTNTTSINLSKIEGGIGEIIKSGKKSIYTDAKGRTVIINGNSKTTYLS